MNEWLQAKHILVVRMDNIGDVVMLSPALRAIKETSPLARLTLLASPAGATAAPLLPWIDNVLIWRSVWQDIAGKSGFPPERELALVRLLAQQHFDAALIFTSFSQTPHVPGYVCYLAGIPLRAGESTEFGGGSLTTELQGAPIAMHQAERNLRLVEQLGFTIKNRQLEIAINPKARAKALSLLQTGSQTSNHLSTDAIPLRPQPLQTDSQNSRHLSTDAIPLRPLPPRQLPPSQSSLRQPPRPLPPSQSSLPHLPGSTSYILIHPGASARSRRYPAERFGQVAALLQSRGWPVLVTGVARDEELVNTVLAEAPQAHSLLGNTTLAEYAALIEQAALVICNNTLPMHLADAVGTPCVVLYSGTDYEEQWRPRTVPSRLLRQPTPCHPCHLFDCPIGLPCLDIAPEQVVHAVTELLGEPANRREETQPAGSGGVL